MFCVAVGVIIVVIHVCCLGKSHCKCDTHYEDPTATVNGAQQLLQVYSQHPPFNPEFRHTAYSQSTYLGQFAIETNETWQTYSSISDTLFVTIKLCYYGNSLFSSPHQSVFSI